MTGSLVDFIIRSLVLFAATGAVAVLLRGRAASVQSLALTTALAGSLLLPAALMLLPEVPVPIFEAPQAAEPAKAVTHIVPAAPVAKASVAASGQLDLLPAPAHAGQFTATDGNARTSSSAGLYLLATLALGTFTLLVRLGRSHLKLALLIRQAKPVEEPMWPALVSRIRAELGIRKRIRVLSSRDLSVPIVAGMRHAILVIPEDAVDWSPLVIRDVVRHELAHVARRDAAAQLVGQIACAVHWFNPLAWAIAARASALRERACDDEVLRGGTRASDYAGRLIDLARPPFGIERQPAVLAMASRSGIAARVRRILDPAVRRESAGRFAAAAALATTASLVGAVGAVEPVALAAEPVVQSTASVASATPVSPVPPAPPAVPAQPAPASLCGPDTRRQSSSMNDDDGQIRWRIQVEGRDCSIDLRVEGRVVWNDAFTDIASLGSGGFFRLDMTANGVRRYLEIRDRGGSLERTYRVAGRDQAWDADARAWLAAFLIDLDRRTAVGVDHRLPRLLQQGGVDAVLTETALFTSDYARAKYYEKLLDARQLSVAERARLLQQAADLTRSDHYASEVLQRVVRQGRLEDARERDAVVAMIRKTDSDHYRTESIEALTDAPLNRDQTAALMSVLSSMTSDHYRVEVIERMVRSAPADADLSAVIQTIKAMRSDHYRSESIEMLDRRGQLAGRARDVIAIAGETRSAHYQREMLGSLLRHRLAEADLLAAVAAIAGMRGDHYQAEALRDVLRNEGATDRVRSAVRDAAAGLSRHYRDEVLRHLGGGF